MIRSCAPSLRHPNPRTNWPLLSFWRGAAFGLGLFCVAGLTVLLAQTASDSYKSWSAGETLRATDLNTNFRMVAPPGTVVAYGGTTAPQGWLLCDGSAVSRSTYADLFAAIGTNFGSGDGSSTFHVPDLRGRFVRGRDGGAGRDPNSGSRTAMNGGGNTGDAVGSVQGDAFQGHWHEVQADAGLTAGGGQWRLGSGTVGSNGVQSPISDGTNGTPRISSETRPVNVSLNYIIRY